jgi:ABC-type lipoprotein export system ATPase subunit
MNDQRTDLIRACNLSRVYPDGDVHALRGVSLVVGKGESVAVTGPSGCGKSTLLHLLGGLDQPTSGSVEWNGKPLRASDLDTFRARSVGFVFQSFNLLATLSSLENVQVPMFEVPLSRKQRRDRAHDLLEAVGMSHRRSQFPNQLSVGERQRVAIARALANEPDALLADEPTGNLDSVNQEEVLRLLQTLRSERGLTLLIVTHSARVAAASDRAICMRDGLIVDS